MPALATVARTAHELGLATAIGGTLFGRAALRPALQDIADPKDREFVASHAWRRFSWLNLAAHGVVAATWLVGRATSRRRLGSLARLDDGLVLASLATGIGAIMLGRRIGAADRDREAAHVISEENRNARHEDRAERLRRAVTGLGVANLLANIALLGITALAFERRR